MTWRIEIQSKGRSGVARYIDGNITIPFDMEIGTEEVVAMITGPPPQEWKEKYSCSIIQRLEVMNRVAEAVIQKKAKNCTADINKDSHVIYLKISNNFQKNRS